jgi:prolyl-tRNA synthetase
MRTTALYAPTRRRCSTPVDCDSNCLLTRGGFVHQQAAGIYTYLPLMNLVLAKVEKIIREEMTKQGAQELRMPVLQLKEFWEQSGRWDDYIQSGTMFHLQDRKSNDLALGPTHEEVICDVVRDALSSHRQMPINLFQIGPKFRDEYRPRYGLIRCREFIMKDAYSFDKSEEGLEESYQRMIAAYTKIFARCGLDFAMVEADSGPIGGSSSHEFMAIASRGEDVLLLCNACRYAANLENAVSKLPSPMPSVRESHLSRSAIAGASGNGSNETNQVFETDQPISSLIFRSESDEFVAAFIRSDSSISPTKLRNAIGSNGLVPASEKELSELAGSGAGIANLNRLTVIADESLRDLGGALPNSIQVNYGAIAINPERNADLPMFTDIRSAAAGDPCAKCDHGVLRVKMGIEVGHVFKLGTRYSKPMRLNYSDQTGRERPVVMGCYGIGVSRIIAAVVEQNHDDKGIVWPRNIAPFTVAVIPTSPSQESRATVIYDELVKAGIDVILDDRDVNLGVKLNDADLIGYPYQAIVGNRGSELEAEVKDRRHNEGQLLHIREFRSYVNLPRL